MRSEQSRPKERNVEEDISGTGHNSFAVPDPADAEALFHHS